MTNGHPRPDEIVLCRDEAAIVLLALDEGVEAARPGSARPERLESAARALVEEFLPDLPEW
jgi:hypothetical protein